MNDETLIEIYINRFINRTDKWGRQWVNRERTRYGYAYQSPDMDTKGGRNLYEAVTPALVHRHLAGQLTCAWSATDENGSSKWLCFDSDVDDGALDALHEFLTSCGWQVIREGRRPGRDGHLWLLFNAPIPSKLLIELGKSMMVFAKVTHLECFPKTASGYSQVRGPLGINLKPEAEGARGLFDGVAPNLRDQLEWLAAQPLNRAKDAMREAEKHRPKLKPKTPNTKRRHIGGRFVHFNILDLVQARSVGSSMVAQCPLCHLEGHDQHQDNLHISSDGQKWCCVFGGPGQVHKNREIVQALMKTRTA